MLSPKKQKFIDFIKIFTNTNLRPPTFVEIMEGLEFKSLGTINWYIVELEKEGMIERIKGFNGKRALSLLEDKISNKLPLLGMVSAGMPLEIYDNKEYIDVPPSMYKKNSFILKVYGDSMENDGILDGDYVVLEKKDIVMEGDTVVAVVNGEATLKCFFKGKNGIELHPRNNKYDIIYLSENDEILIQGKVAGVFRQFN